MFTKIIKFEDIITGYRLSNICDNNVLIDEDLFKKENEIIKNSIICFKTDIIIKYYRLLRNLISNKIIISHFSDYCINKIIFENLLVQKWYALNVDYITDNLIPIPLGFENDSGICKGNYADFKYLEFIKDNTIFIDNKKHNKIYINFNNTEKNRKNKKEILLKNKNIFYREQKLRFREYLLEMSSYKYVASPRGNGIDCHRTWEALFCGCIPLVDDTICNKYFSLFSPIILISNWNNITESFLDQEYNKIINKKFTRDIESLNYYKTILKRN